MTTLLSTSRLNPIAACLSGRTFSIPFMCRTSYKEFNACLGQYTTDEAIDERLKVTEFAPLSADINIRDGFRGDFFGTAKDRYAQYARENAEAERRSRA